MENALLTSGLSNMRAVDSRVSWKQRRVKETTANSVLVSETPSSVRNGVEEIQASGDVSSILKVVSLAKVVHSVAQAEVSGLSDGCVLGKVVGSLKADEVQLVGTDSVGVVEVHDSHLRVVSIIEVVREPSEKDHHSEPAGIVPASDWESPLDVRHSSSSCG